MVSILHPSIFNFKNSKPSRSISLPPVMVQTNQFAVIDPTVLGNNQNSSEDEDIEEDVPLPHHRYPPKLKSPPFYFSQRRLPDLAIVF
ncbi:hypothetical protein NPIL_171831 [Nephila pilipes]|uniref:Uncharacterized protein n=1 Tax=Nephila pilipes TaxID=299642 RepID=A0A8X6T925_NEPPI|nr:hypothetical protein NPIL_171831 [Nephila pilipes]